MLTTPSSARATTLGTLSDFVAAKLGLSFPPARWRDLERALRPAASEMGFESLESYARWLQTASLAQSDLEALAEKLTIGETYFFREPQAFAALRETVVPEIVASRPGGADRLRIWSAGCCSGEEAYSLAIFFDRMCPDLRGWQITILGTDINPHFLHKARVGVYRHWSFRGAPDWLQRDYFTALGDDRFELRPDIRRRVEFEPLNLAQDNFPALHNRTNGLDLIFCRNVLMYFSPAQVQRVVAGFHRSLADGGHLVVGVCEASSSLCPQLQARPFPGATFYQKQRRPIARAISPIAVPPRPEPLFEVTPPGDAGPAPLEAPSASRSKPPPLAEMQELFCRGEYAAAAERLQAALAQAPFDLEAATLLARALANQGHLAEARRWVERALAVDKLRAPLHHLRGAVLHEQGERELAAESMEKALYLDPNFVLAHLALADLATNAGREEKASRHLAQALRWLRDRRPEEIIPEADGLTAGRLIAMVEAMRSAALAS